MSDTGGNEPQRPVTPLGNAAMIAGKRRRKPLYLVIMIVAIAVACAVTVLEISSICASPWERANRVACASNMKQIGLGVAVYANAHGGRFPDDLDTLFETGDLMPAVMICPSSNDSPPSQPTSQPVGTKFLTAGHVSYIYVGKGLTDKTALPDVVVLYEPLGNHGNSGMNVLFGDFHVEWLTAKEAQPLLKQVAAGVFPVRLAPATQPAQFPTTR